MLDINDYKNVLKGWNKTQGKKVTDSTVDFIYKGFWLHKYRSNCGWGITGYHIWNDHNPMFPKGKKAGPYLWADNMKDAKKQIDDLLGDKDAWDLIQKIDQVLLMKVYL